MTITQATSTFAANQYELVSQERTVEAVTGRTSWTRRYECTQTGVDNLIASGFLIGSNFAVRWVPGGRSEVVATWPYDPGSGSALEAPVDDWTYEEIPTQPSIWTHPQVAPQLIASPDARKNITEAVDAGTSSPYPTSSILGQVYLRILRGTDSWEGNRPTIRRVRTYSGTYSGAAIITLTTTVYSRASLISNFSPPSDFQPRIPVNPTWTAPDATTWGWRKGPQTSSYNRASRRWEEISVFEGGFWDQALYTFA